MSSTFMRHCVIPLMLLPVALAAQAGHASVRLAWAWGGAMAWHVQYVDSIQGDEADSIGRVVTTGKLSLTPEQCDLTPAIRPCTLRVTDAGGVILLKVGGRTASSPYLGGGSTRLAATRNGDWRIIDSQPEGSLDPAWAVQALSSIIPLRWPDGGLTVGDTWHFEWLSVRLGKVRSIDSIDARAQLDSIVERSGRRSAWISITGHGPSWTNYRGDMAVEGRVVATVKWDLMLGHPVAVSVHRISVGVRTAGTQRGKTYKIEEFGAATISATPRPRGAIP